MDLSGDLAGTPRSDRSRLLYSESLWPEQYGCNPLYGVLDGAWKYIQCPQAGALRPRAATAERRSISSTRSRRSPAACGAAWRNGGRRWLARQSRKTGRRCAARQGHACGSLSLWDTSAAARSAGEPGSDLGQEDPKDFVAVFERCKEGCNLMEKHRYRGGQEGASRSRLASSPTCPGPLLAGRDRNGRISSCRGNPAIVGGFVDFGRIQGCRNVVVRRSESHAGRAMPHVSRPRADEDEKPDQAIVEYQTAFRLDPVAFEDHMNLVTSWLFGDGSARPSPIAGRHWKSPPQNVIVREQAGLDVGDLSGGVGPQRRRSGRNGPARGPGLRQAQTDVSRYVGRRLRRGGAISGSRGHGGRGPGAGQIAGQTILALEIQSHLDLYRAGRPWRETPKKPSTPAAS